MYSIVFLDADDTVFDFKKAEKKAFKQSFEKYNYNGDYNFLEERYHKINKTLWSLAEKNQITIEKLKMERFKLLFNDLKIDYPVFDFGELYLGFLSKQTFLLNGAVSICRYISERSKIIMVTNGIDTVQKSRLKCSDIEKYISGIVTSEEAGVSKPNPDIFEFAVKKYSLTDNKSDMIMIGDNLLSDILGGINFGIDTCWFNPEANKNNTGINPAYEISELSGIRSIFEKNQFF
ncbi:MAG: YjjG family noncanonical pyrimidine nucleotidase [Spirochaetes bacterium]|nr:YjjG family noncanonical pyrimidine nucleotidase [Spirochaetota bacterium]